MAPPHTHLPESSRRGEVGGDVLGAIFRNNPLCFTCDGEARRERGRAVLFGQGVGAPARAQPQTTRAAAATGAKDPPAPPRALPAQPIAQRTPGGLLDGLLPFGRSSQRAQPCSTAEQHGPTPATATPHVPAYGPRATAIAEASPSAQHRPPDGDAMRNDGLNAQREAAVQQRLRDLQQRGVPDHAPRSRAEDPLGGASDVNGVWRTAQPPTGVWPAEAKAAVPLSGDPHCARRHLSFGVDGGASIQGHRSKGIISFGTGATSKSSMIL